MELIESVLIVVALLSLLPMVWGYRSPWYQGWLAAVLVVMAWVAVRRLGRTRKALEEQRRKRDGV